MKLENFIYHTPTKVIFGRGTEKEVGRLVKEEGGTKVLIHYGSGSVKRFGLLKQVHESLEQAGIPYIDLGGVQPNPRLSKVYEGINLCRKENVDFLLAVGGGSVIDSCKAIGYGLANPEVDVWELYRRTKKPIGCYPVGVVLTISAAGSEMSNSSVITKEETKEKRSCNSEYGHCRFAVMNPELTVTLSAYQTASGCVDILMHTIERYFTVVKPMSITDAIAEGLMRDVIKNAKVLKKEPNNYNARASIMWAGSLSHNGLTGCGGISDFATHHLQHELGALFDVTHGAGLAALWGSWARYVYLECPGRFARFAVEVMGVKAEEEKKTALAGITALEDFFRFLEMPVSITDLLDGRRITDEVIEVMADKASAGDTKYNGNFKLLTKADLMEIYRMAR